MASKVPARRPRSEVAPPGVIIKSGENLKQRARVTEGKPKNSVPDVAKSRAGRTVRVEIAPPGFIILGGKNLKQRARVARGEAEN